MAVPSLCLPVALAMQLVHTLLPDGSTQLRVLLAPMKLGPALPMQRVEGNPDAVRCLEVGQEILGLHMNV